MGEYPQTSYEVGGGPLVTEAEALDDTVHVSPHLDSDRPTQKDLLGFTPYVRAMADYLSHPATTFPITISVEGEWGAGKTSFMEQLKGRLGKRGFATVWFAPWTHRKPESLWAAFALTCVEQLAEGSPWWKRPWLRTKLLLRRLRARFFPHLIGKLIYSSGLFLIVWLWFIRSVTPIVAIWAGETPTAAAIDLILKVGAFVLSGLPVWKELNGVVNGILELDLRRYLKAPDYAEHLDLLTRLHQDFKAVLDNYTGKKPVVVFIDDLDRCGPDVVAEMMQAVNLLISDDPRMVFVIGLDREVVAAAFAARSEKLLPHLAPSSLGTSWGSDGGVGLSFGLSYLEKFITLPFRLPRMDDRAVERLIDGLVPRPIEKERGVPLPFRLLSWLIFSRRRRAWASSKLAEVAAGRSEVDEVEDYAFAIPARARNRRQRMQVALYEETESVKSAVTMVAPLFDYNPRRLKQFLNLLRLRAHMANETGLFDEVTGSEWGRNHAALTLPQLVKLVAIDLKWPNLLREVQAIPDGMRLLTEVVYGRLQVDAVPVPIGRWAENRKLAQLLRQGCSDEQGQLDPALIKEYGVGAVDLTWFTSISPQVLRYEGTILKDRPWNYTEGSLNFWRQNKRKLGVVVRAVMRDDAEPDGYYLRLIDEHENEIWFGGLTAGYGGTGPAGTVSLLLDAGFGTEAALREFIESNPSFDLRRPDVR